MPKCNICWEKKKNRQMIPNNDNCRCNFRQCLDCHLNLDKLWICHDHTCRNIHYQCPSCRSDECVWRNGLIDPRIRNNARRLHTLFRVARKRNSEKRAVLQEYLSILIDEFEELATNLIEAGVAEILSTNGDKTHVHMDIPSTRKTIALGKAVLRKDAVQKIHRWWSLNKFNNYKDCLTQ